MRFVTLAAGALAFTLVGFGSCLLLLRLQSEGRVNFRLLAFLGFFQNRGQVSGDPPVTVSDGSLHAHSKYNWLKDTGTENSGLGLTINPAGAVANVLPTLQQNCKMVDSANKPVAARLWTDTGDFDVAPGATVIVTYGSYLGNVTNAAVTIQVPQMKASGLTITTLRDSFGPAQGATNDRQHTRFGYVSQIIIRNPSSSPQTWKGGLFSTFTLGFCYQ